MIDLYYIYFNLLSVSTFVNVNVSRLMDVNRDLFSGQSVVRRQGSSLVINTDMLNMASQFAASQNIVVATVSPVHLSPTETQTNIIIVPVDSAVLRRTESDIPVATAKMVD